MRNSLFTFFAGLIGLWCVCEAGAQAPPPVPGTCESIAGQGQVILLPQNPTGCEPVDIYYFYVCFNLTNVTAITAEVVSVQGSFSTNLPMAFTDSLWVATFFPPPGLTNFSLRFKDNTGVVDGDGVNRWRFGVTPCPTFQFSPAFPNVFRHDVTLTYNPGDGPLKDSTQIVARVDFGNGDPELEQAMTSFGQLGIWQTVIGLPPTTTNLNVRFFDPVSLVEDTNDGPGWTISISTNFGSVRGDLNGDGFGDLVLRHPRERVHGVILMRDGVFESAGFLGGAPSDFTGLEFVAMSDLDGDGREDIIARVGPGVYGAGLLDGATILDARLLFEGYSSIAPWQVVAGGDFNFDGWGDLALYHPGTGQAIVALLEDGVFVEAKWLLGGFPLGPFRIVAGGDFEGGGGADLLLRLGDTAIYGVLLNPLAEKPEWVLMEGIPSGHQVVAVGDFNGSGITDLVLRQEGTGFYRIGKVENFRVVETAPLLGVGWLGHWVVESQR
ncbi:MAG TPA: VCBS repeat-containing protein [Kiritimatiellia bacterium]|nr:VCBS repeat-containing protein [Kiritimatiellia bacterium]